MLSPAASVRQAARCQLPCGASRQWCSAACWCARRHAYVPPTLTRPYTQRCAVERPSPSNPLPPACPTLRARSSRKRRPMRDMPGVGRPRHTVSRKNSRSKPASSSGCTRATQAGLSAPRARASCCAAMPCSSQSSRAASSWLLRITATATAGAAPRRNASSRGSTSRWKSALHASDTPPSAWLLGSAGSTPAGILFMELAPASGRLK
mmetsp:Transcript_12154/g.30702  ORF Transcript_12154/g.30702 Transcript_12154/m.30702 type:complete len:208 (+) Transcript_12154:81-704(+)